MKMKKICVSGENENTVGSKPTGGKNSLRVQVPPGAINPWPNRKIKAIYGPYLVITKNGDIRRQLCIHFSEGNSSTISYARWLMMQHIKTIISPYEHIDHKNCDPLDDRIDNYQILTSAEHQRKHNQGRKSPLKGIERGWEHGTQYGWMKRKCICEKCTESRKIWHDNRNALRRKGPGYKVRENRFSNTRS